MTSSFAWFFNSAVLCGLHPDRCMGTFLLLQLAPCLRHELSMNVHAVCAPFMLNTDVERLTFNDNLWHPGMLSPGPSKQVKQMTTQIDWNVHHLEHFQALRRPDMLASQATIYQALEMEASLSADACLKNCSALAWGLKNVHEKHMILCYAVAWLERTYKIQEHCVGQLPRFVHCISTGGYGFAGNACLILNLWPWWRC